MELLQTEINWANTDIKNIVISDQNNQSIFLAGNVIFSEKAKNLTASEYHIKITAILQFKAMQSCLWHLLCYSVVCTDAYAYAQ